MNGHDPRLTTQVPRQPCDRLPSVEVMTDHSTAIRRRLNRIAAGAIGVGVVAVSVLTASPALAAVDGDIATTTTVKIAGDLQLHSIRYDFLDGDEPAAPGPNVEAGPASTNSSATWSLGTTSGSLHSEMVAQIVDFDRTTDYWIKAFAYIQDDGRIYGSDCQVFLGDPATGTAPLSEDNSPYQCWSAGHDNVPGEHPRRLFSETFTITSLNWAAARGAIMPQGTVKLGDGHLESPSTRFIVDGRWYPSDPSEQAPYVTIEPGATLNFAAFRRNGESDANAEGLFSYRIYDSGVPTRFWVSGMASNWRGIEFNWDYACEIYDGDPLTGALVVSESPYSCDMSTTKIDGNADYRVDFTVQVAPIQTLGPLQARDLIAAGCGDPSDACYFVPTADETLIEHGEVLGAPYANTGDEEADYSFYYATARSITHTFDVSVSAEVNVLDVFKASIKLAYGYENTDETSKKWVATMKVPAHKEGWFEFAPAYRKIAGDFLFETDGTWYRVTGGTFTVPDDKLTGHLSSFTRDVVTPPDDEVGVEPPATPGPLDPTKPGGDHAATNGDTSGALAATGTDADLTGATWAAVAAALAGAALVATRIVRRRSALNPGSGNG